MTNLSLPAIILIKSEEDIKRVMDFVKQGSPVGFQIDVNVDREEYFRLMFLINEQYKTVSANANFEIARVA